MENYNQNNSGGNNYNNNIPQLEPIDLKELFLKILKHWVYIVATVFVFMVVAFIFNRYATRLYKTEMTLLIEDESSAAGPAAIMERMGYSNPRLNFFNEKLVLESYSQIKRTIDVLDFDISYFTKGNIRSSEVFRPTAYGIEYDTLHPQISGLLFDVELLDNNNIHVDIDDFDEDFPPQVFNFKTQTKIDSIKVDFKSDEYKVGEWIEGDSYKFKINIENLGDVDDNKRIDGFSFMLNTDETLSDKYHSYIKIAASEEESSGMNLSTVGSNGAKDVALLNAFADVYLQYGIDLKNEASDNTILFIDNQLQGIQDSLNYAEDLLQQFRSDNKVIDLGEKGSMLLDNLLEVEGELSKEKFKLDYYNSIRKYMNKKESLSSISAPSAMGIEDPLMNKMIVNLIDLYSQRTQLRSIANENNPQIIALNSQIQQTRRVLKENLRNIISNTKLLIKDYDKRIEVIEQKVQDLPKTERSYIKIERKFKLSEQLYTFLMEKRAEAGIAKAGNVADNKVIDYAKTNRIPLKPKTKLTYAIAILLGLIFPIGIILILDYLDNKIKNRKQLEKATSIPILGVVGHSDNGTNLVVHEKPRTGVSESFRAIRADLNFLLKDKTQDEPKVILLTSSISGEGKTFASINLSTVLAKGDKKVVLVGVDLRKPRIYMDFNLKNDIGLSNYLINQVTQEQIVQETFIDNLSIISAGPIPPNPSELLLGDRFEELIENLKKDFEYIILDTPPIGLVADAFHLMHISDVNLFMVRQNYTEEDVLGFINSKYENNTISNISIIFNDFTTSMGYGYGKSGYGYGYGYYED